jgi:hypothetical protein
MKNRCCLIVAASLWSLGCGSYLLPHDPIQQHGSGSGPLVIELQGSNPKMAFEEVVVHMPDGKVRRFYECARPAGPLRKDLPTLP